MQTIQITIENLMATASPDATIVSDNTGYVLRFCCDSAWDAYPVKTAVFVWHWKLETFSTSVAFEGDTVAVPKLPAVAQLLVGLTAGDLQTTTPAVIPCQPSILSGGGEEPEPPTQNQYDRIMAMLNEKVESVSAIAITEHPDGHITVVNTLPGGTETIVLMADENGTPESILYNGAVIPISWRADT